MQRRAVEDDAVGDAGGAGDRAEPGPLVGVALVAADDPEPCVQRGRQHAECFEQQVGALHRIKPADEEDGRAAGGVQLGLGQREPRAGIGAAAGVEAGRVEAAGDDPDAVGIRAVEAGDEIALLAGRADQQIGAGGGAALARDPQRRLHLLRRPPRAVAVLDLAQRVEGRRMGQLQPPRQLDAGQGCSPVVRMHEVVAAAAGGGRPLDRGCELVHVRRHLHRRQRGGRPDVDADDLDAVAERGGVGLRGIGAPRVDVRFPAQFGHLARELGEVDVHPAGLGRARQVERRRVRRDHHDAPAAHEPFLSSCSRRTGSPTPPSSNL